MAAIGGIPFERGDDAEGFLIVTAAAAADESGRHSRPPASSFCHLKQRGMDAAGHSGEG